MKKERLIQIVQNPSFIPGIYNYCDRWCAEAAGLKDAVEVVRWYQDLIYAKLARAVEGELEGTPEILKDYPKDSDGSAKVALIGIDRSIAAWGSVRRHFPDQGDRTLDLLVELERLRRRTEDVFPNARSFVRPGFDDTQTDGMGE